MSEVSILNFKSEILKLQEKIGEILEENLILKRLLVKLRDKEKALELKVSELWFSNQKLHTEIKAVLIELNKKVDLIDKAVDSNTTTLNNLIK